MEVRYLFSRFLDNGGTREEFKEGRRIALQQAKARSERHAKEAQAAQRERMYDLQQNGYTENEAKEFLRNERFEELESSGAIRLHAPIKRVKISPYSWRMI